MHPLGARGRDLEDLRRLRVGQLFKVDETHELALERREAADGVPDRVGPCGAHATEQAERAARR